MPYGEKSEVAIQNFSKRITQFLIEKKCKTIVIACNSASSVAFQSVKEIAKTIPVFNVITPVVNKVVQQCSEFNIGVIGTKATIQSNIYEREIKAICSIAKVSSLATPLLAPMIEEGFINESIRHTVIANYLSNKKLATIDHLILACTHYPLIHQEIKDYYKGEVVVIDSANIVAEHIAKQLEIDNLLNDNAASTEHHFYVSNYTKSFEKSAKFFFREDLKTRGGESFGLNPETKKNTTAENHTLQLLSIITSPTIVAFSAKHTLSPKTGLLPFTLFINAIL